MRKILTLTVAAVLLLMSIPAASAKSDARPIKGVMSGELLFIGDADCDNPWKLRTASAATGNISHLGRTEMNAGHCTPTGPLAEGGEMTLTAANGDQVFIEYEGLAAPLNEDGIIIVDVDFVVVGGDGRFDGAHGHGDMIVFAVFEGFDDFAWPATWVLNGEIGY